MKKCVEVLGEVRDNVYKKYSEELGIHCLESLNVFGRYDALASAVLQIVGLKSFLCRPSSRERMNGSTRFEGFDEWEPVLTGECMPISSSDMMLVREDVRTGKKARLGRQFTSTVVGIDFIHLQTNQLSKPPLHSVTIDFNCSPERAPSTRDFYLNVGDVVWLSCATRERVKGGKALCKSSFTFLGFIMDPSVTVDSSSSNVLKRATLAISLFGDAELKKCGKTAAGAAKSIFEGLSGQSFHGKTNDSAVATVLKTGTSIYTEMNYFKFCFSRDTSVPMSFNLACMHSRLLQRHVQRFMEVVDRQNLKASRAKSYGVAVSGESRRIEKLKALSEFISCKIPKMNGDQVHTISKILQWSREMEDTFSIDAEQYRGNGQLLESLQKFGQTGFELRFVGALPFFVRGPPGTGKSILMAKLTSLAVKGHMIKGDGAKRIFPTTLKHILITAHTNAAVDEILLKVINTKEFKSTEDKYPIVRVGLNPTNDAAERVQRREILKSITQTGKSVRSSILSEADLIGKAEVVFITIGSMSRPEFVKSTARFDMVIMEEAAKIQDGDLLTAFTWGLGGKVFPESGCPLPLVLVGDERQLAPYTGYDPNTPLKLFKKETLFERYLRDFLPSTSKFDFCEPMLLKTQHRSHSAIAAVYSSLAYDGTIQTGARIADIEWSTEKMEKTIMRSRYPAKAVSVLRYNGEA